MSAPYQRLDATIVRMLDYGEADRIVGLFTLEQGMISAFAPGARKSRKRFGAGLDFFTHVWAEVKPPPSREKTLWHLRTIELKNLHQGIRSELLRLAAASYLAECLWLLEGEGHAQASVFHWWLQTLARLSDTLTPFEIDARLDLDLLAHCGYSPKWDVCTECGKVPGDTQVFFSFSRGGVTCRRCRKSGEGRWMKNSVAQMLTTRQPIPSAGQRELTQTLDAYVAYTLGRLPKSQKFRQEVLRGNS